MCVDDLIAGVPKEGSTFQFWNHPNKNEGSDRQRGKAITSDEEIDSTDTDENPLNKTSAKADSTQAPTTISKMAGRSSKRPEDNAEARETIDTTERPASASPTQRLGESAGTAKPISTTVQTTILKPSRSDLLKKSLLALDGNRNVQVGYK